MSNTGKFPSVATYSCQAGFSLQGNKFRTCLADGSWSGYIPRCTPRWEKSSFLSVLQQMKISQWTAGMVRAYSLGCPEWMQLFV